jgi:hypothetical protein
MDHPVTTPFHAREYNLYVVLGALNSPEMWQWENWEKTTEELDPLVFLGREKIAIRTTQFIRGSKKSVSFGRILWNKKSHQKWTHASPTTIETSKTWSFLRMEMWSPTWAIGARENSPPDIFFAFRNEAFWPGKTSLKFNQTIIFAVSGSLDDASLSIAHKWVLQLSAKLKSPLAAYQSRTWGKAFGNGGGFSDSIQDMLNGGLFKVGDYHNRPVDLHTFQEPWKLLHSP